MLEKVKKNRWIKAGCGERYKNLCSEVFKKLYTEDDIKTLLLFHSKNPRYYHAFKYFPKNENKSFEENYLMNFAKGLHIKIYSEFKKREKDLGFSCDNLHAYINKIISNFLLDSVNDIEKYHQVTVNQEIIIELRRNLNEPELNLQFLRKIGEKPLTKEAQILLERIKEIPGYNHAWFKHDKNNGILYMYITEDDKIMKAQSIIRENTLPNKHYLNNQSNLEESLQIKIFLKILYQNLKEKEKCVFLYRIALRLSLKEVIEKCWERVVNPSNVQQIINNIIKKAKRDFLRLK